jgi:hypothetical protein
MANFVPSRSQRALDRILSIGGETAERIKGSNKIHPTKLSMYRRARSKPNASTIALLAKLSSGEVPADGWETSDPDVTPAPVSNKSPHDTLQGTPEGCE